MKLSTEGRETGELGAVALYSGVPLNLQMSESHILIRLLQMCFPRNWEFGSALSKLRNFGGGGGFNPPKTPPGYPRGLAHIGWAWNMSCVQWVLGSSFHSDSAMEGLTTPDSLTDTKPHNHTFVCYKLRLTRQYKIS
jgi:hypothetical protein